MKPTNLKSLVHICYDCIERLSDKEAFTYQEATAISKLANNVIRCYQHQKEQALTEAILYEKNKLHNTDFRIKNLDGKPFDEIK